jgi:hypothetical protein
MNDLEWLNDQRPEVEDDEFNRARARRALIEHANAVAPPARRRAAWRPRLAFVGVAALVAAGMAVAWPAGEDGSRLPATPLAPEQAVAAPLVLLSQKIAAEPEPKGDATLVIRHQQYPDGKDIPGHDLYLDDGRYFYGSTKDELRDAELNSRYHEPLVKAAIAAPDLPADEARHKMDLALGDGNAPKVARPIEDNHVWTGSMDALIAGAGRKDVRAGVMVLLATIKTVKVTDDGKTLTLTATDYPGGYTENLIVDAETGVPRQFVGGVPGEEPGVTIDYEIKRVTAASWADAAAEDAAGQAPVAGGGQSDRPAAPPKQAPEA